MPRTLHVEPVEAALGKRTEAMGAKFLERVKFHDHEIQSHMPGSGDLARMIAANVGVIDKAGHSCEQCSDDSEQHSVKGTAHQIGHFWKSEANEIEQETQNKKSDWKMNQHR